MNALNSPDETPTVLIVDDEQDAADLYAGFLEPEYRVITAYGGKEAIEKFSDDVDVVLLDRRMPDFHGDAVLEEIRASGTDCRVVMVTAVDPDIDVISLNFDDYLVKPVSSETLRDAVDRMITRNVLDDKLLEALALASKMATLESKMDPAELEESEEYAELERRFTEFKSLLQRINPADDLYAELSAVKMEALFTD